VHPRRQSSFRIGAVAAIAMSAGLLVARDSTGAVCDQSTGTGTGTGTGSGTGSGTTGADASADFAGCPEVLPACSSSTTSCCYKPFQPTAPVTAGAVIIPMDRCHQTPGSGTLGAPGIGSPDSFGNAWCADPIGNTNVGGSTADDGMFHAYGLVYRLLQKGIPVYWIINPSKDPPKLMASQNAASQQYNERDIDIWVLNPTTASPPTLGQSLSACTGTCVDPVQRLNPSSSWAAKTDSYNYTAFPVRGGAFVIAPEDRTRFDNFIKRTGEFASLASNSYYDFSQVDMYAVTSGSKIVYQDFRPASGPYPLFNGGNSGPVAYKMNFSPPRLARQSPAGVSQGWLSKAKLDQAADSSCASGGAYTPADAVYCDVTHNDIQAGRLVSGKFSWAWLDNWSDNSPCADAAEVAEAEQIRNFMTANPGVRPGGSVIFMQAIVSVFEGCKQRQIAGKVGNSVGLIGNNQAPSEPLILRRPSSLFMQWGDLPTGFASGSPGSWYYATATGSTGYDPAHTAAGTGTLVRLVTQDGSSGTNTYCTNHKSSATCDVFSSTSPDNLDAYAYLRYNDEPSNGLAVYLGGNQVTQSSNLSHLRAILDSFLAVQVSIAKQVGTTREVSRSAPIVATVGDVEAQYQGTFAITDSTVVTTYEGVTSNDTFEFPYYRGHLRAYDTSKVTSSTTKFASITPIFDVGADGMIPPVSYAGCATNFASSCRTVFTTTANADDTGLVRKPPLVMFTTTNRSSLKPLLSSTLTDSETTTLIQRVLAGTPDCNGGYKAALGGIDRSTMAVIEDSPLVAGERPTMIYVGGLDGMLHAICAEKKGACDAAGRELWAYIPKTQLNRLRKNSQRVDGSPAVADVLDDFDDDGTYEWKTVLTFQTGSGDVITQEASPAVVAMDISNPASPSVLWVRVVPAVRTAVNLGVGINVAVGPARIQGTRRNVVYAQTNNGGTGAAGYYLAAYDAKDGDVIWAVSHEYPAARDPANPPVPTTGIPGGVAAFDTTGTGTINRLAVPTLYGDLWVLDATSGSNVLGTVPAFRFSTDYHPLGTPPAVYRDLTSHRLAVVVADGGYADPLKATWTTATTPHYAVSVAVDASPVTAPIRENGTGYGEDRPFLVNLGVNERVFGAPLVVGEELLVVTDTTDPNESSYGAVADTGKLHRYLLDSGEALGSTIQVSGGGSAFDAHVRNGIVYVGSGSGVMKVNVSTTGGGGQFHTAADTTGPTTNPSTELPIQEEKVVRLLWLVKG
jgi:hypothetical protein